MQKTAIDYLDKEHLLDELAKGHKVIPVGTCDNFDYEHGCQGHPIPDDMPGARP